MDIATLEPCPWDVARQLAHNCIKKLYMTREYSDTKSVLALLSKDAGRARDEVRHYGRFRAEYFPTGTNERAAWSAYAVICLYAIHQKGNSKCMDSGDQSFAFACSMAKLVQAGLSKNGMAMRMSNIISRKKDKGFLTYLRKAIPLLSQKGIPVNYGMLAADLYSRNSSANIRKINERWEMQFFSRFNSQDETIAQ